MGSGDRLGRLHWAGMRLAAIATALSCLLLVGCGGSSDDSTPEAGPGGGKTLEELWRAPGDDVHRAFAIGLLRVEGGRIAEIVAFHEPALFPVFGLPATAAATAPVPAPASPPGRG